MASARAGSDMSSIQGSEEHQSTQAATSARGQKRGRDNEIEKVRTHFSSAADRTFPLSATLKYAYGISKRPKTDHLDRHEEKRAHRKECALICVDVDTLAARRRTKRKRGEGDALRPLPKTSMPPLVPEDENEARGFWEEIEEQAMRPPTKRPRRAHLKRGKYKDGEDEASSRAKTVAGGRPSGPMSNSRRGAAGRNITSSSADPVIGTKSRGKGKGKQVETTHQPMPSQEAGANMAKKFGPSGPELTQTRDQEETFMARPSVQLVFPDHIKSILVDDWEYVTKNLQLVHLPCEYTVNRVLDDYYAHEKDQRRPGSAEADILEEFNSGMRDYFDKCLGKILLYRFERDQFYEVRDWWEGSSAAEHENIKGPADVYGAEHLARLFGESPLCSPFVNRNLHKPNPLSQSHSSPSSLPPGPNFFSAANVPPKTSGHARTHRPNQHGPASGPSSARRTRARHAMARPSLGQILYRRLPSSDAGIHRQGSGQLMFSSARPLVGCRRRRLFHPLVPLVHASSRRGFLLLRGEACLFVAEKRASLRGEASGTVRESESVFAGEGAGQQWMTSGYCLGDVRMARGE